MKYYTGALVNDKKKKRVSAFFLGDRRRTSYYQARHREEDLYLLWIEGIHPGKMICYPCVLERGAEQMVFENGSLDISKQNNQELVDAWIQTVNPENILTDFEVTPLEAKDFNPIFSRYRKEHLDRAIALAEEENRLAEEARRTEEAREEEDREQPLE